MSQGFSVFLCERIVLVSVVLTCSEVLFRGDLFAAIFVRTISAGAFRNPNKLDEERPMLEYLRCRSLVI